jgi:hypothetical protein
MLGFPAVTACPAKEAGEAQAALTTLLSDLPLSERTLLAHVHQISHVDLA